MGGHVSDEQRHCLDVAEEIKRIGPEAGGTGQMADIIERERAAARGRRREGSGRTDRAWCPEDGPGVPIDDDGCCHLCGATATGPGAETALLVLDRAERANRSMLDLTALDGTIIIDMQPDGCVRLTGKEIEDVYAFAASSRVIKSPVAEKHGKFRTFKGGGGQVVINREFVVWVTVSDVFEHDTVVTLPTGYVTVHAPIADVRAWLEAAE